MSLYALFSRRDKLIAWQDVTCHGETAKGRGIYIRDCELSLMMHADSYDIAYLLFQFWSLHNHLYTDAKQKPEVLQVRQDPFD